MDTTINWAEINRHSIEGDRVLLQRFVDDYQKFFGKLNIGCGDCISDAYEKLIHLKQKKMASNCDYKLKAKYEGTWFEDQPIRNGDLTNKLAKAILARHPGGESLFDVIPETLVKRLVDNKLVEIKVDEKKADEKKVVEKKVSSKKSSSKRANKAE